MKVGIIGLPNAGKSTLYNAVTRGRAATAGYPFTTVEPNVARVSVHDDRLERLAAMEGSARAVPAWIEVVDIAGLVEGASRGEGMGNRFLAHVRESDALVHVLRSFDSGDVAHVSGSIDPGRDRGIVDAEILLADLEIVSRRREKTEKPAQTGEAWAREDLLALCQIEDALSRGCALRRSAVGERAAALSRGMGLISRLPVVYVINGGTGDDNRVVEPVDGPVLYLSALWEEELESLAPEDAAEFRETGTLPPLFRLVNTCYQLLDLNTFFTANENQATAWRLQRGGTAWDAAGKVHTDIQAGFIRAEVARFTDLDRAGSFQAAREAGHTRTVGRDYPVEDGDVLFFRFHP